MTYGERYIKELGREAAILRIAYLDKCFDEELSVRNILGAEIIMQEAENIRKALEEE